MNAARDWNRKGSPCGGVLGQLSHEVLVQHCVSSGLRLKDHTSNLFLTIVITLHLFQAQKYYWKARDQRSKECLTRATTRHDSKQSNIHHTSSPELSDVLWFLFSGLANFREHIFLARTSISALFSKHHSTYLQDNETNRTMWCGPRLGPNFYCKRPAVQKVWPALN